MGGRTVRRILSVHATLERHFLINTTGVLGGVINWLKRLAQIGREISGRLRYRKYSAVIDCWDMQALSASFHRTTRITGHRTPAHA